MIEEHFYISLSERRYNIRITNNGRICIDMHERACHNMGCDTIPIFEHHEPAYTSICKMFADWRNS